MSKTPPILGANGQPILSLSPNRNQEQRDVIVQALANGSPSATIVGMALRLMFLEGGEAERDLAVRLQQLATDIGNAASLRAFKSREN